MIYSILALSSILLKDAPPLMLVSTTRA
jgi:hypothetical protein